VARTPRTEARINRPADTEVKISLQEEASAVTQEDRTSLRPVDTEVKTNLQEEASVEDKTSLPADTEDKTNLQEEASVEDRTSLPADTEDKISLHRAEATEVAAILVLVNKTPHMVVRAMTTHPPVGDPKESLADCSIRGRTCSRRTREVLATATKVATKAATTKLVDIATVHGRTIIAITG